MKIPMPSDVPAAKVINGAQNKPDYQPKPHLTQRPFVQSRAMLELRKSLGNPEKN